MRRVAGAVRRWWRRPITARCCEPVEAYFDSDRYADEVADRVNGGQDEPLLVGVLWPNGEILKAMHMDCLNIITCDDEVDRAASLSRLLKYTARGQDLAGLLGLEAPGRPA